MAIPFARWFVLRGCLQRKVATPPPPRLRSFPLPHTPPMLRDVSPSLIFLGVYVSGFEGGYLRSMGSGGGSLDSGFGGADCIENGL